MIESYAMESWNGKIIPRAFAFNRKKYVYGLPVWRSEIGIVEIQA